MADRCDHDAPLSRNCENFSILAGMCSSFLDVNLRLDRRACSGRVRWFAHCAYVQSFRTRQQVRLGTCCCEPTVGGKTDRKTATPYYITRWENENEVRLLLPLATGQCSCQVAANRHMSSIPSSSRNCTCFVLRLGTFASRVPRMAEVDIKGRMLTLAMYCGHVEFSSGLWSVVGPGDTEG